MAKRQTIAPEPIVLTREQQLARVNEEATFYFNHLKEAADKKLKTIREQLTNVDMISNTIGWKAAEILECEVDLHAWTVWDNVVNAKCPSPLTPWEGAKIVYRHMITRFLEQSSLYGEDLNCCSTSPAHNAMAMLRNKALGELIRRELTFVTYNCRQLGEEIPMEVR